MYVSMDLYRYAREDKNEEKEEEKRRRRRRRRRRGKKKETFRHTHIHTVTGREIDGGMDVQRVALHCSEKRDKREKRQEEKRRRSEEK